MANFEGMTNSPINWPQTVKLVVFETDRDTEVFSMYVDNADAARPVAEAMMASSSFARGYVVGIDFPGKELFKLYPPDPLPDSEEYSGVPSVGGVVIPFRKRSTVKP